MSPRPYNLGQRQVATDETRRRIVAAAREILADDRGPGGFTIDEVARRAGVARMTVYYQFQSKRGVLEALFDDLANRGLVPHLARVFQEPKPLRALEHVIDAFARFWHSDRVVLRRARALAALDAEVGESVRARDERRREHLRRIVGRIYEGTRAKPKGTEAPVVDVLHMLTSFETFDALMTGERTFEDATRVIRELASAFAHPLGRRTRATTRVAPTDPAPETCDRPGVVGGGLVPAQDPLFKSSKPGRKTAATSRQK